MRLVRRKQNTGTGQPTKLHLTNVSQHRNVNNGVQEAWAHDSMGCKYSGFQSQEKETADMRLRLAKQCKIIDCCACRDLSQLKHLGSSWCTWREDHLLSWGQVDSVFITRMLGAHGQSWWMVFPRCRTFDMMMTIILSSPLATYSICHATLCYLMTNQLPWTWFWSKLSLYLFAHANYFSKPYL